MSKIDSKIQKLKELEKQLELEKRKIQFLNHILASAEKYEDTDFTEVKSDVVAMLRTFVETTTNIIENGPQVKTETKTEEVKEVQSGAKPVSRPQPTNGELSPAEKLDFAMNHRNLAGKMVTVANNQNLTIKGKVTGLDAPFVLVAIEGRGTIKVPIENVSEM